MTDQERKDEIEALHRTIRAEQPKVDLYDALSRLRENKDFKFLVEKHFFKEEPARLMRLGGSDEASKEVKEDIVKDTHAISRMFNFFQSIEMKGRAAEDAIANHEADIVDLTNMEVDDE